MKNLYREICFSLREIVNKRFGKLPILPPWGEIPPQASFGDFSTMVALKIGSYLKKGPFSIACILKEELEKRLKGIEKIEIVKPGFINLFFARKTLLDSLKVILKKKENYFSFREKRRVLIEFVSANPTGPLSIAHGRQAVVGDIVANVLEFFGNRVVREYYLNDVGRQIDLLITSVEERMKEIEGKAFSLPQDGYWGDYVKDIAKEAIKKRPKNLKGFVLSYILNEIKKDLKKLGVRFERWVSQKELINKGKVEKVIALLERKGLAYVKDGALWFPSTKFGDDKDRVLMKSDGEFTYFASDIAYHKDKVERGFDKLINLWGPDHHGYIKRVKISLKALGFKEDILDILIIQLVKIKTKERMSRRRGTAISLSELVEDVGKDAARFYYTSRKNSSHLEFDIDKAKEASFENPLYYIQYAHARICSIFRKKGKRKLEPCWIDFLKDEKELLIIRKILQLSYCLERVYYTFEPVFLIEYLKDMANHFHKFYEERKVLGEDEKVTRARLALLEGVRIVLSCGLKLLGIEPARRM
ncbi:MAG: arginine--tRNA ligase [Candidatus Omnitrophota bacterium]|nr:MAG: arginine--tRNA ligase [Candidatus Omnitrophota bacterium]